MDADPSDAYFATFRPRTSGETVAKIYEHARRDTTGQARTPRA
jgi:hypothetical protein